MQHEVDSVCQNLREFLFSTVFKISQASLENLCN